MIFRLYCVSRLDDILYYLRRLPHLNKKSSLKTAAHLLPGRFRLTFGAEDEGLLYANQRRQAKKKRKRLTKGGLYITFNSPNLLSFLTPQVRERLMTICAGAEWRNGD